jgi:hypothetical protein
VNFREWIHKIRSRFILNLYQTEVTDVATRLPGGATCCFSSQSDNDLCVARVFKKPFCNQ